MGQIKTKLSFQWEFLVIDQVMVLFAIETFNLGSYVFIAINVPRPHLFIFSVHWPPFPLRTYCTSTSQIFRGVWLPPIPAYIAQASATSCIQLLSRS